MNLAQKRIPTNIARVRLSLQALDKALRRLPPVLIANMRASMNAAARPHTGVSTKTRAARVLQGRYMGFIRQLKPRQKAQVRRIREIKGMRVAIAKAIVLARANR